MDFLQFCQGPIIFDYVKRFQTDEYLSTFCSVQYQLKTQVFYLVESFLKLLNLTSVYMLYFLLQSIFVNRS